MNATRTSPIVSSDLGVPSRARVLVVDDESAIADTIAKILTLSGFPATAAYDGNEALETALLLPPELLITDVALPGMNGIELAVTIKRIFPNCKILLFSGQASTLDLIEAAGRDGQHFTLLNKLVPPQDLLAMVAQHLKTNPAGHAVAVA
jgi:CheY-like chemotaxis protein